MKKKHIIIIIALLHLIILFPSIVFSQHVLRKRLEYNSNGGLKHYFTYSYDEDGLLIREAKYRKGFFDFLGSKNYEYDENKKLIKMTIYDSSRRAESYTNYEYNEDNYIIKETEYTFEYNDKYDYKLWEYTEYKYNKKNKLIKLTKYNPLGKIKYFHIYKYDKFGRLLKESFYNMSETLLHYTSYTYDFNNNVVALYNYQSYGLLNYYRIIEYNESGTKIKELVYDGENNIDYYYVYEYDETTGKLIKKLRYNKSGDLTAYTEFEYIIFGE